ncbi:hypothetical protein QBC32DRAFT_318841 [Pseudoneurospora amorphoporcata]|uniref:non-specific serine/threonine protein kinase n=1 Tax=Pseudoneurospora amorphoporcata TaxID=241081 RepID=A0AAN6SBD7_9PEZI|nr:hypothetical protein QBC32DRAFT_318841 [Pseudoneurospora amorphoporcata]
MSTAFQTTPNQSIPVSATTSPSNRQYSSFHPDPTTREGPGSGYYANQHNAGQSSSHTPAQQQSRRPSAYDQPTGFEPHMSSRTAIAQSSVPVPVTSIASDQPPSSSDRRRSNMPTAVPPRTSSRHDPNTSSRRAQQSADRAAASRPSNANGTMDPAAVDEAAARSRRQHSMAQDANHRTSNSRGNPTTTQLPVRSQPNATGSRQQSSRDASEILNDIPIQQPEIDIERERERLAQAQAHAYAQAQAQAQTQAQAQAQAQAQQASNYNHHHRPEAASQAVAAPGGDHGEESRRGHRSRHDHSKREKHTKFGEYILGNTIGEGEFGKVKLGWKQEGGVQVAIKLIKKDTVGNNPSRMAKIMREVAILKQLTHPNIVRLHKMEESDRHYGIVLEYASGGELFDYILNHRYLKDNAARRLFAQLVSGVGYLHKKGIVHRDLKLENLLLDRNRNIIITDFGFANTFDPHQELSEEEELNLSDREFVKRMGLDKVNDAGWRKGDLMQTSCGSPCYAAPELVVSDSLYTGRKVDVWSCGVILYAMLAGYLPFDDDPANPEGDNINLLYKYIVNTPLTFPEYVTPHARDLLRRILVPNPRKRADLFEVARHSWLSEYSHVVEFITSSTTTPSEIQNTTVPAEDEGEPPHLARSASVREATKKSTASPAIGGLVNKQGTVDPEAEAAHAKQQRDNKRRTVQVEYVAPNTTTQRGDTAGQQQPSSNANRNRSEPQAPVESSSSRPTTSAKDKQLLQGPSAPKDAYGNKRRPPSSQQNTGNNPTAGNAVAPPRPSRDGRPTTENQYLSGAAGAPTQRPTTGGSMQSGRPSYGQPAPPEVADANVHGRIQQPFKGSGSGQFGVPTITPAEQQPNQSVDYGSSRFDKVREDGVVKGHKRSSTMGELGGKLFGRSGSLFGGRKSKRQQEIQQAGEKTKRYPPVSMNNSMPGGDNGSRPSLDSKRSRRSFSMGMGKKSSGGSITGSNGSQEKSNKRFSFIPPSLSRAFGYNKEDEPPALDSQQDLPIQEPSSVDQSVGPEQNVSATTIDGMYTQLQDSQQGLPGANNQHQYGRPSASQGFMPGSDPSVSSMPRAPGSAPHLQTMIQQDGLYDARKGNNRANRGVLQKNKRFVDYEGEGFARPHDHSGSSGPARKVMDFFRRRGKARGGENN